MSKIRPSSIQTQHLRFSDLTKEWPPDFGEGSLSKYLVKHGIDHLFELEDTDGVRNRLLDLHFFNELYEDVDWTVILKYWRTIGEEKNAGEREDETIEGE